MLQFNSEFKCDCGKTHKIDTEILQGVEILSKLPILLKKYYGVARIGIVYDKAVSFVAQNVLQILLKSNFEVSEICYEKLIYPSKADCDRLVELKEDVRFFIAIGGGSICNAVRYSANIRNNDFGIVATSPSTDSYLDDFCVFMDKREKAILPKFVLLDEAIYSNCPEYLLSSGIGAVFSCNLSIFMLEYKGCVYKQKYCLQVVNSLKNVLDKFCYKYQNSNNKSAYLMTVLMKISLARHYLGGLESSADMVAFLLQTDKKSRFYGENLFLASYVLTNLYKLYLENYAVDTLIPADYVKGIKLLNLRLPDYDFCREKMLEYEQENLVAISFLIREYRADFLQTISKIEVEEYAKLFRRCYFDAGFWMGSYIKATELLQVTSLAGLIGQESLFSYMKQTGFLEEMI